MKIRIIGGEIRISHKLKKNETYRLSRSSKAESIKIFKKPQLVTGFSNVCSDNKGILVIDYDGVDKSVVEEDYSYLQGKYGLPRAYLLKTKESNFHVICLKKFSQAEIFDILKETRCDDNFKSMAIRNPFRSYVLRISNKEGSKKPKFVGLLGQHEGYLVSEISEAHFDLLNKIYPKIEHPFYENKDGLKEVKIQTYETA